MIERYSLQEMKDIWELESKFSYYLKVEIAVCEAYNKLGKIPDDALAQIKQRAAFSVKRIDEIEKEVGHDVIAFLTNVNENVGEASRYIHMGMTSSDVIDTAFALQIKKASEIIESDSIINRMEHEIERDCLNIISLQQPIAGDLRNVTGCLKIITDIERIADHCTDICEIILYTFDWK